MWWGKATEVPATRTLRNNFIMDGGILCGRITHDDGASYYVDTENVLVYGGVQNNNACKDLDCIDVLLSE